MLDKVLKAWDCCNPLNRRCYECPYEADCFHDSFDRVAIADMVKLLKAQQAEIDRLNEQLETKCDICANKMLKEQEAVKPLAKEDDSYECICGTIVGWDELDASGIVQTRLNYCPSCGKPIDWEGR